MIEEKYIHLMQQELDGLNSPNESEELRALLSANDELRGYYDGLKEVFHQLDEEREVSAPPDLYSRIIQDIPFERYAPRASIRKGLLHPWSEFFSVRYALSFSLGSTMGALLVFFLMRSTWNVDYENLTGALNDRGSWVKSEPVVFGIKEMQGEAVVSNSAQKTQIEIHLKTEKHIEVSLEYDQTCLSFVSFSNDVAVPSLRLDNSLLYISHSREGHYTILFNRLSSLPAYFKFKIRFEGKIILERYLP